jgi:micrococcal nuclease
MFLDGNLRHSAGRWLVVRARWRVACWLAAGTLATSAPANAQPGVPAAARAQAAAQHDAPLREGTVVQGRVVRVLDSATVVLRLPEKVDVTLRLHQAEPPASCQPGAAHAQQALVDLALAKDVQAQVTGRDAQGRTLATVLLHGQDLAQRLVVEGHAFSVRWRHDDGPLVKEERRARALRRGLHADGGALRPGEFTRQRGPCAAAAGEPS